MDSEDQVHYRTCLEIYGDPSIARYAFREILYWKAHSQLPEWSRYIQSIEVVNGSLLIVHHDPDEIH